VMILNHWYMCIVAVLYNNWHNKISWIHTLLIL